MHAKKQNFKRLQRKKDRKKERKKKVLRKKQMHAQKQKILND